MEISYVFYTNSSYYDIIKIQYEYISNIENKILITDKLEDDILNKFKKVLYYDDSLPYSQRILNSINKIDDDLIFLIHDNDIIVERNNLIIEKCIYLMRNNNYDRIDFQVGGPNFVGHTEIVPIDDNYKYFLSRNSNADDYIFNVNPSIWRVSTLREILKNFPEHSYRNIEDPEVQKFCAYNDLKIFKLKGENMIKSTPFTLLDFFQYIHITHAGNFLPLKNTLSDNLKIHYSNIVENHNLLNGNRKFDEYHTWEKIWKT